MKEIGGRGGGCLSVAPFKDQNYDHRRGGSSFRALTTLLLPNVYEGSHLGRSIRCYTKSESFKLTKITIKMIIIPWPSWYIPKQRVRAEWHTRYQRY